MTAIQEFYDFFKNHYVVHKKPKNVLKCVVKLAEETGEVAEAILAFVGNEKKTQKLAGENDTPEDRLAEELGDVIIVALNTAHAAKLDLDQMFLQAGRKMKQRTDKRIADKLAKDASKLALDNDTNEEGRDAQNSL
jgi:NTP pyrophosphatase (non-canonical NTP hydrolase)